VDLQCNMLGLGASRLPPPVPRRTVPRMMQRAQLPSPNCVRFPLLIFGAKVTGITHRAQRPHRGKTTVASCSRSRGTFVRLGGWLIVKVREERCFGGKDDFVHGPRVCFQDEVIARGVFQRVTLRETIPAAIVVVWSETNRVRPDQLRATS